MILPTIIISAAWLYIYRFVSTGALVENAILMTVAGLFINGTGNIVPSAVSGTKIVNGV